LCGNSAIKHAANIKASIHQNFYFKLAIANAQDTLIEHVAIHRTKQFTPDCLLGMTCYFSKDIAVAGEPKKFHVGTLTLRNYIVKQVKLFPAGPPNKYESTRESTHLLPRLCPVCPSPLNVMSVLPEKIAANFCDQT